MSVGRRARESDRSIASDVVDTDDTDSPAAADRRALELSSADEPNWRTRFAGLFLFLPLQARLGFAKLVAQAGYPGTRRVPADAALLSLLTLKLLDKERHCHIDDFNFEDALGLFAGLNVLPKKSFASDYSYRTQRIHQQRPLNGWVKRLSPLLLPEARSFSLDFHPIPHRGEDSLLETTTSRAAARRRPACRRSSRKSTNPGFCAMPM